jgi:hypothetical protein
MGPRQPTRLARAQPEPRQGKARLPWRWPDWAGRVYAILVLASLAMEATAV